MIASIALLSRLPVKIARAAAISVLWQCETVEIETVEIWIEIEWE